MGGHKELSPGAASSLWMREWPREQRAQHFSAGAGGREGVGDGAEQGLADCGSPENEGLRVERSGGVGSGTDGREGPGVGVGGCGEDPCIGEEVVMDVCDAEISSEELAQRLAQVESELI